MNDFKMSVHKTRLKLRRKMRRQRRNVEGITEQADDSLNRLFFKRVGRLQNVRRFTAGWILFVAFIGIGAGLQVRGLDSFYLRSEPTTGGVHREGIIGTFTTASPLFATTPVDSAVSELVFDGLFRLSPAGELEPALAESLTTDITGTVYTVVLKPEASWHDGESVTAEDVVFTYEKIQDEATRSPFRSSWIDVEVDAVDDTTVTFTLPNKLSSFEYSLINGIVPEHVLSATPSENLRSSIFNTVNVVGSGQFLYSGVEVVGNNIDDRQERVTLTTNDEYHSVIPGMDGIVFRTYRAEEAMIKDFENKVIASMAGLNTISTDLTESEGVETFSTPLSSAVMLFFNTSNELLADRELRRALVYATDTDELRRSIEYQLLEVDSPFLKSQFAYNEDIVQFSYDIAKAEKLLEDTGWLLNSDGIREKDGKLLQFRLVSQSLTEYASIVQKLQESWSEIGVQIDAVLQPEQDIQSGAIARHDYDMLLYGISIGPDPDVFAYWHSSQADLQQQTRLNLSEYSSKTANESLEAGRTREGNDLRRAKYEPFLEAWQSDAPAIALYQPRFLYVVQGTFEGYRSGQFSNGVDRFYSVANWMIRNEKNIKQ